MADQKPTLADVARKSGVSRMSVSRALRDAPYVSAETRKKVLDAAAELGYRPDPQMAKLASLMRGRKKGRTRQATLGIVRYSRPDDALSDPVYRFVSRELIEKRAGEHGYEVDEFFLNPKIMSPQRLRDVLLNRGIEGIVMSIQSSKPFSTRFDFEPFASAVFGFGLTKPALHRVTGNVAEGLSEAVGELRRRGYRRIGLAITDWIDRRSYYTYSGTMLHCNEEHIEPENRVPPLVLANENLPGSADRFCRWIREFSPDVVISLDRYVPDWLEKRLGMKIPGDIGLLIHDWESDMAGLAGIDHRRDQLAAAAVDLVANQLMRNQKGLPDPAWHVLIPPRFVEGESIRGGVK